MTLRHLLEKAKAALKEQAMTQEGQAEIIEKRNFRGTVSADMISKNLRLNALRARKIIEELVSSNKDEMTEREINIRVSDAPTNDYWNSSHEKAQLYAKITELERLTGALDDALSIAHLRIVELEKQSPEVVTLENLGDHIEHAMYVYSSTKNKPEKHAADFYAGYIAKLFPNGMKIN